MKLISNQKGIELIVMDFDGTIYSNTLYMNKYYNFAVTVLKDYYGYTIDEAQKILLDNKIYPNATSANGSVTQLMLKMGMGLEEWNLYREKCFRIKMHLSDSKIVNKEVLYEIAKTFPIFLLTNNTLNVVRELLENMNISEKIFEKIITADDDNYRGDKLEGIKMISKISGIKLQNILSVGDKFCVDIEPFIKIGGNGFLVEDPKDIEKLWLELKEIK